MSAGPNRRLSRLLNPGASPFSFNPVPCETVSDPKAFPFQVLDDTDPLVRYVPVRMYCQDSWALSAHVLVVQTDDQSIVRSVHPGITNADLEEIWNRVLRDLPTDDEGMVPLSLNAAVPGGAVPFLPLYYCREVGVFFEPPCPVCGAPLDLCRRDDLLEEYALPLYSASAHRFLFCPSCADHGKSTAFYTKDPLPERVSGVAGPQDLVGAWTPHLFPMDSGFLPCRDCPEAQTCFGSQALRLSRLTPFSFYPFHAMLTPTLDLKATEFLDLATGTLLSRLVQDARRRGAVHRALHLEALAKKLKPRLMVYHDAGPRRFLETLQVKLSFLSDLLRRLVRHRGREDAGLPQLDSIWVSLPKPALAAPTLWVFRTHWGPFPSLDRLPTKADGDGEANLGNRMASLWLQVLAAPKDMGEERGPRPVEAPTEIRRVVLDSFVDRFGPKRPEKEGEGGSGGFGAAHQIWGRAVQTVEFFRQWPETTEAGGDAARHALEEILTRIGEIQGDIRSVLFSPIEGDGGKGPESVEVSQDRLRLIQILEDIHERWRRQGQVPSEPDVMTETVILGSSATTDELHPPEKEPLDALEETIVIESSRLPGKEEHPAPAQEAFDPDETIVVDPGRKGVPAPAPQPPMDEDEDLESTIILGSGTGTGQPLPEDEDPEHQGSPEKGGEFEDPEATLILKRPPPGRK